jgi:hypothetical protein
MGLFDKFLLLAALAIAIALFLTIGWMAIAPDDPRGAVSLVSRGDSLVVILQAGLLAAVTAAIATVMVGSKLPDVGVFAAAMGLAFVSLQGETAAYLLIDIDSASGFAHRGLAAKLAAEAVIWFLLMLLAMLVSGLVSRWCGGALVRGSTRADGGQRTGGIALDELAISECPVISGRWIVPGRAAVDGSARWNGLRTLAIMTIAALLLYGILVSGSSPQMIRHGQTCFAVFAAFFLGGWIARRTYPARTAYWGVLAVPLTLLLGYVWTIVAGSPPERFAHLTTVPASDFLRALPLTFISVGTLGVLAAHWMIEPAAAPAVHEQPASALGRRRPGRRDGA